MPPAEIIADSKSALRRRLLRISWAPGLLLLGLWYVLLVLYVVGASPTFWFLTLLVSLGEPAMLRATTAQLGLTAGGLWAAFLLLPLLATVVSLAVTALAPSAIAGMDPRRHLSERGVHRRTSPRGSPRSSWARASSPWRRCRSASPSGSRSPGADWARGS